MFKQVGLVALCTYWVAAMPADAHLRAHGNTASGGFQRSWSDLLMQGGGKNRRYIAPANLGPAGGDANEDGPDVGGGPTGSENDPPQDESPIELGYPNLAVAGDPLTDIPDQTQPLPAPGAALLGAFGLFLVSRLRSKAKGPSLAVAN